MLLQIPHLEIAYRYWNSNQGSNPFKDSDDRLGRWQAGLWTSDAPGATDAWRKADATMRDITAGAAEIRGLQSEAGTWDARGLMVTRLLNHSPGGLV